MNKSRIIFIIIGLQLLVACGTASVEQTLVARHEMLSTEIQDIRRTATIQAAQMETTRAYYEGRVTAVLAQRGFMQATLIANGINIETANPVLTPIPTNTPLPPTATQVPTQVQVRSRIEDITLTRTIDGDLCPVGSTTQFSTNEDLIYIAGVAKDVPAGTTITARWIYNGRSMDNFVLRIQQDIDETCVYFNIDSSEIEFTPGNWTVTIDFSNTPGILTYNFEILDE